MSTVSTYTISAKRAASAAAGAGMTVRDAAGHEIETSGAVRDACQGAGITRVLVLRRRPLALEIEDALSAIEHGVW